jgi:hypothetical protein
MRLQHLFITLFSVTALCVLATPSPADLPQIRRQYTFLPQHSRLDVTGGFVGGFWPLMIDGDFGLVTGWEPTGPLTPAFRRFARFVDVEAELINLSASPLPAPATDLNATLNLTGLDGIPSPGALYFRGEEPQGGAITVTAVPRGPLLILTSKHQQPCCDFYHYELRAVAVGAVRSDFNGDSHVNEIDLDLLSENFGKTGFDFLNPAADYSDPELAALAYAAQHGDANADSIIDGADLLILQTEFGTTGPGALLDFPTAASSIPEPATCILAAFACGAVHRARSRFSPPLR